MWKKLAVAVLVVGSVGMGSSPAMAQLVGDDVSANAQAPWNTLFAGTISQRAPGNLVRSARQQFQELHGDSISRSVAGPEITETPPDPTLGHQVKAQVIQTLFDNLNVLLTALQAAIQANAGLTPQPGPGTDGGSNGGTGGDGGTGNPTDLLGVISGPG